MATPAGRTASTRQQLDELDALLQRMLALPMDQLEQGLEPPAVPLSPPPPPLLPVGGLPGRVAPPTTWSQPEAVPLPFPDAPPPADLRMPTLPGMGPAVLLPEVAVPVGTAQEPPPAAELPVAAPVPASAPERRIPVVLWPLAWGDRLYVGAASLFGPPGRFFAGPAGKNLLGWSGVLMLLGAAGWGLADWFGWIG